MIIAKWRYTAILYRWGIAVELRIGGTLILNSKILKPMVTIRMVIDNIVFTFLALKWSYSIIESSSRWTLKQSLHAGRVGEKYDVLRDEIKLH